MIFPDVPPAKRVKLEVSNRNVITKPEEASAEFGVLLNEIIQVLMENEANNLKLLKSVCSSLTIKDNSGIKLFSDEQLKTIMTCASIRLLFLVRLCKCWRWDDFSVLSILIASLCSDQCAMLLAKYEEKIDAKMKLKEIHEYYENKSDFPEGYHKMVAITHKLFSDITKEDYDEIKSFVSRYCGVEFYAISPFIKASTSLEWYIPGAAVAYMIETASVNKQVFIDHGFVYLKITTSVIFDEWDTVSEFIFLHIIKTMHAQTTDFFYKWFFIYMFM